MLYKYFSNNDFVLAFLDTFMFTFMGDQHSVAVKASSL